jgi:hypothetical protein
MLRAAAGQFSAGQVCQTRYILSVREFLRKHARFFLVSSLAALVLRLLLVFRFPGIVDDSHLYANLAKNWMQHSVYAVTDSGQIVPTLSRLPGYPAFLAVIFFFFGADNFRAVLLVQVLFDLITCFLVADIARRLLSPRAAKAAFLLAALCPFLANYAAAALTETLEICFTALALDFAISGLNALQTATHNHSHAASSWIACGLSIGASILLRPDGGILLAAVAGYLSLLLLRTIPLRSIIVQPTSPATPAPLPIVPAAIAPSAILRSAILVALCALAPLVPWTLRNLHTLHRFQPLAPRYANDADEPSMTGFNRWIKTWIADYVSVEEVYWNVPGDPIDVRQLPRRAFDSAQERDETAALFAAYNQDHDIAPDLDARFAALASTRIHAAPLRYYAWLPALRIADMWLRPRTELLPSDPRWWQFNDDARWLAVSVAFGSINLLYLAAACAGAWRSRKIRGLGLLLLFLLLRSLFLASLENPEPRYTLECYPVVIFMAAALFIGNSHRNHRKPA